MRRKRFSKEEQAELCAEWQTSGLTRKEFCKRKDIHIKSLYRWLWQEKQDLQKIKNKSKSIKFLPLTCPDTQQPSYLEIVLPNGIHLKAALQFNSFAKLIKELL